MNKFLLTILAIVAVVVVAGCLKKQPAEDVVVDQGTGDEVVVEQGTGDEVVEDTPTIEGDEVAFNLETSVLNWAGERIVGNAHQGTVKFKEGVAIFDGEQLVGGSAVIDMPTIEGDNEMAINHLKTADFFDVETYPEATIVLKEVTTDADGNMTAVADLTIKDITNEVTFPVTVEADGSFHMVFTIDRTLWDIKYDSGTFFSEIGDRAIRDEIEFDVVVFLATAEPTPAADEAVIAE